MSRHALLFLNHGKIFGKLRIDQELQSSLKLQPSDDRLRWDGLFQRAETFFPEI